MSSENYMKKEFDEIVRLCEEAIPECGDHASYFMEPATEEEIMKWEEDKGISIPESYKLWLKLTKNCQIRQTLGEFHFPLINQSQYIPDDYIIIGNIIGDGELVCFSKSGNNFVRYFEGKVNGEFNDFREVILKVKDMFSDYLSVSMEEKMLMLKKLKEIRNKSNDIR